MTHMQKTVEKSLDKAMSHIPIVQPLQAPNPLALQVSKVLDETDEDNLTLNRFFEEYENQAYERIPWDEQEETIKMISWFKIVNPIARSILDSF